MKLWLLRPQEDLPASDNPWEPWYDKAFGFVVWAETESDAREIAHKNIRDEAPRLSPETKPWLTPRHSTCVDLLKHMKSKEPQLVIRDFQAA